MFAVSSQEPLSPMVAIDAMDAMREGHDGSGVGLLFRDLSRPFEELRHAPILSGIFSKEGLHRLDEVMTEVGFRIKYKTSIGVPKDPPLGTPKRDIYLVQAYEYPEAWKSYTQAERFLGLVDIRLRLRAIGEEKGDMIVFSFWPDVIMIKEIGDPLSVAEYLNLDRKEFHARVIMAQGRHRTPIMPSICMPVAIPL